MNQFRYNKPFQPPHIDVLKRNPKRAIIISLVAIGLMALALLVLF